MTERQSLCESRSQDCPICGGPCAGGTCQTDSYVGESRHALTPEYRKALRREIDHAQRQRVEADQAARYLERRLLEDERSQHVRHFYVCQAIAYSVGGVDHHCAKRAEPGSCFCRLHQEDS